MSINISNHHGTGGLDLSWWGLKQLEQDRFWVDHEPEASRKVHGDAGRLAESVITTIEHHAVGSAGIRAATVVQGALALAQVVVLGPELARTLGQLSGLSRVAEFLRRLPPGDGARYVLAGTGSGGGVGIHLVVAGTAKAAAAELALTEAEVWALVRARRLGQAVGQLYMLASGGGGRRGGEVPGFETIRGSGPERRLGGVVYIGKGAAIRQGPGGLKERLRLTFRRVPRQKADFDATKRRFLLDLAKDPQVRSFFGDGSPELARLEAGKLPGKGWEIHHNIPATAEAPGIEVNNTGNFSLLPKWLHTQVSKEWERFLTDVAPGGTATFEFPIFDRFVPSHGGGR